MNFLECSKQAKEVGRPFAREKWGHTEVLVWEGSFLKLLIYAHFGTGTIDYQAIDSNDIFADDWELR